MTLSRYAIISTFDIGTDIVTQITDGSATAVPSLEDFDLTDNGVVVFLSDSDLTGDNVARDTHVFSIDINGTNLTQVMNLPLNPENLLLKLRARSRNLGKPQRGFHEV